MKFKTLSVVCLLFLNANLFSQDVGINVSAVMQPTMIDGKFTLITGGRVGANLTPEVYTGIAIYGTTLFKNTSDAIDIYANDNPIFEMNYFGLEFEYFLVPEKVLHPSFVVFAGIANTFFTIPPYFDEDEKRYFPSYYDGLQTILIKPGVNININIKPFYRIVVGAAYRFIPSYSYKVPDLVNKDSGMPFILNASNIEGFSINLMIKFGSF
ncbi:MAG: hypothetical protein KIT33_04675 [Candidatus Kapabacteria bacterium]|nr:hypothetical protein [Ignavibacteriota bacterium]MCW5884252.1 hypothetical protein [Candidatus Kapabacteria bacterium]